MDYHFLKARKIIKYTLISIAGFVMAVLIAGSLFTYFYRDAIIQYFVSRANERLDAPVNVRKIDVSFLASFPNISIVLDDVSIPSSAEFKTDYLAKINTARFTLNPFRVMKGDYEVDDFILENGEVYLEINALGENNYQILKKREDATTNFSGAIQLILKNIHIHYADYRDNKLISFNASRAAAKVRYANRLYNTRIDGNFLVNYITIDELEYFKNKNTAIKGLLLVDDDNKFLTIQQSAIKIENGDFEVQGDVSYLKNTKVNLTLEGVNTSAQTLVSILPEKYAEYLKGYKSTGELYFRGTVVGEYTAKTFPNSKLSFGAANASFFHPSYNKAFKEIHLTGEFESGIYRDLTRAKLSLKGVRLSLDGRPVEGELEILDFQNPYIKSHVVGKINLNSVARSFPNSKLKSAYGEMDVNVRFSGKPKYGKSGENFDAHGEVLLHNVSFILEGERLPFNHFNGSFMFRKNDLAISNFSGKVGNSDFLINGFFKNLPGFINKGGKTIKIEADLSADYLDFDELLKSNFASRDTVQVGGNRYAFNISPDIDLNFNCNVNSLKLSKFTGTGISGNLRVLNRIAVLNDVNLSTMGGRINLSGSVNNRVDNVVEILCESTLNRIYIDSVFYVFNNFKQSWLVDENLKGQIQADVNTYILLDNHLNFYSKDFKADINASIYNGELIDFEPMQRLSRFVEEKSLAHLKFSEMRNNIKIENRTVYIPEMLVSSSVSNIQVSGTHTFDQQIEYHLAVPLKNFLRVRKLSSREIEESTTGTHLLLKIEGTTDDYTIKYDTRALKKKLAEDIKGEGKELKRIFQEKGRDPEKVIKVEEEEYFDF